jgi:polar amino acid transport system substrate-binding protein
LSQSIGTSLLGVATLKRNAFNWNDMSDLSVYTLGVVDGYSNGETFDNLVRDKKQLVELAPSDAANTQKLLQGKVKGIVIDRNVLRYTLSRLKTKEVVVFNPKPIAELTLHVCFQKSAKGKKLKEEFDSGLKQINLKRAEAEYLNLFRYD